MCCALNITYIFSKRKKKNSPGVVILQPLVSNKFSEQFQTALASAGLLSGICTTSPDDMSNLYHSTGTPKAVLIGKNLVRVNCQLLSGKDIRSDHILPTMTGGVLSLELD